MMETKGSDGHCHTLAQQRGMMLRVTHRSLAFAGIPPHPTGCPSRSPSRYMHTTAPHTHNTPCGHCLFGGRRGEAPVCMQFDELVVACCARTYPPHRQLVTLHALPPHALKFHSTNSKTRLRTSGLKND